MIPTHPKLLLDTNIIVDLLEDREPFSKPARLMIAYGAAQEASLWISAGQITDLLYILSKGGKPSLMKEATHNLQTLRQVVRICPVGEKEIDDALASAWEDKEDAVLYEIALKLEANAIITRNKTDFEKSLIPVYDCAEYFHTLKVVHGLEYEDIEL